MWTARIEECPACHKGVAVRPLTGKFWRHGTGRCCPGSDKTIEELLVASFSVLVAQRQEASA